MLSGLRIVDYKHTGRAVRLHATALGAVVRAVMGDAVILTENDNNDNKTTV